jgi:hypothetical protein
LVVVKTFFAEPLCVADCLQNHNMGKLRHLACFLIDDPIDAIANFPPTAAHHFIADYQGPVMISRYAQAHDVR